MGRPSEDADESETGVWAGLAVAREPDALLVEHQALVVLEGESDCVDVQDTKHQCGQPEDTDGQHFAGALDQAPATTPADGRLAAEAVEAAADMAD